MANSDAIEARRRTCDRFVSISFLALFLGSVGLLAASLVTIEAPRFDESMSTTRPFNLDADEFGGSSLQPLLRRIAGVDLIRPSVMTPAARDDGTAARLAKLLKLSGVIQVNNEYLAYIQVEKEGIKAVRERDSISEFIVEKVDPGEVTLSFKGVVVMLRN